jgi:glycerol-3-phosphate acyltransferase PlsY
MMIIPMTVRIISMIIIAYLVGSFPTALILSKYLLGVDIRRVGDGNMGAQNASHVLGQRFGLLVGMMDISKGAMAVLLAKAMGLPFGWVMVTGVAAILGHDFPLFAKFKGGQGTATTVGVYLVFFPLPVLVSLIIYGLMYAIIHRHTISAAVAGGLLLVQVILLHKPLHLIVYVIVLYICIPIKKFTDSYRVEEIQAHIHKKPRHP